MLIFNASDYPSRSDLETAVRNKSGLTTNKKDAQIKGTTEDLKRLSLHPDATFWGISCVQADPITEATTTQQPMVLGGILDKPVGKPAKRRTLPTKKKSKKSIKNPKKK